MIATDPIPEPRSHARSTRGAHCGPVPRRQDVVGRVAVAFLVLEDAELAADVVERLARLRRDPSRRDWPRATVTSVETHRIS